MTALFCGKPVLTIHWNSVVINYGIDVLYNCLTGRITHPATEAYHRGRGKLQNGKYMRRL
ncbi:hypothetical protein DBS1_370003 [Escherichia coli]|nr:hypothetical protein DBS1_370003 [Escherichia coli]